MRTLLMLHCSSIICLLLLPKNHAFNNNNIKEVAGTQRAGSSLVAFGSIKGKSQTFLKRHQPTSSSSSSTVEAAFAYTRLRMSASPSDKDTRDSREREEVQALSNATTVIDQLVLQHGTRFRRWAQKARFRFNDFVQRGQSLFHWRRARTVAQTQQATICESSLSKLGTDVDINGDSSYLTTAPLPNGPRWAIAHPEVDLSGTWKPLVTKEFKKEYDVYLQNCGTNFAFRQVCLNFCSLVRETIQQEDHGRILHLTGTSPAGTWERSLVSSGADCGSTSSRSHVAEDYEPIHTEFLDPDKELVKVEAWWEGQGRVHTSFLRNKPKVHGGEFESKRYLTTDEATGDVQLVCESTFHPPEQHLNQTSSSRTSSTSPFKPAFVRWRYRRV